MAIPPIQSSTNDQTSVSSGNDLLNSIGKIDKSETGITNQTLMVVAVVAAVAVVLVTRGRR